jgi:hypothetical protein
MRDAAFRLRPLRHPCSPALVTASATAKPMTRPQHLIVDLGEGSRVA